MPAETLARTRLRVHRSLRIALSWVIVGCVVALFEHNAMLRHGLPSTLQERLAERLLPSLFAGVLGGFTYIFVLRDRWRKFSYVKAVAIMAVVMFGIMISLGAILPALDLDMPRPGPSPSDKVFGLRFLGTYLYWTLLMAGTMLMVRLNDQYGSGGINYLTGRYHKPRQEMRIFMFLDMRSSTTIAERIGHVQYFKLLNELYADITDSIVYSRGEIYQYVGDEISVSWSLRKGVGRQRCIRCFLDIRAKLQRRAKHYEARYGHAPLFKAGFHYGPVTAGEVGLVKKERIYTGDVVNTAAHIQGQCNAHGVDNLISQDLLDVLRLPEIYEVREIGSTDLKGKKNAIKHGP
ncbi:MAG: adenylate/guanylate cyclase domain-containing protein [Flavobacteriales bacterium]